MIFCSPASGPSFPSLLLAFYELLMRLGALLPRFLRHSSQCLCCSFPAAAPLARAGHRGAAWPPAASCPPEVPGSTAGGPGQGWFPGAGLSTMLPGGSGGLRPCSGCRGTAPRTSPPGVPAAPGPWLAPVGWQGRGVLHALLPAPAHSSASAKAPPEAPSGIHILAVVAPLRAHGARGWPQGAWALEQSAGHAGCGTRHGAHQGAGGAWRH